MNAEQTVDWRQPVTELASDDASEVAPVPASDPASDLATLSRAQENKTSRPKEASSALSGRSLAKALLILLDTPQEYNNPATLDEWSEQLAGLIKPDGPYDSVELSRALQWALTRDKFWPTRIFKAKNVVDNAASLVGQFRGQKKAQKNAAEPAAVKPNPETKPQQSTYDWRKNAKLVSQS